MYLALPLFAAIVFALGSIAYKRAYAEGAGLVHAMVVNNVLLALLFLPLFAFESKPIAWSHWHMPFLTALPYVVGHWLLVLSLQFGDVSLATPLLGAKVIFVAALGWLIFGVQLEMGQWLAAALATGGVIVMGLTDFRSGGKSGLTTIMALGCAAAFACTDVMIQSWGDRFGTFNFLPLQFIGLGALSAAMMPFFGFKSLKTTKTAWKWVLWATALSALQAILITATIAIWHDAAGVNVLYATRGLWSIVLVWGVGHHFGNKERETAGARRLGWRLAGAILIVGAVILTTYHGRAAGANEAKPKFSCSQTGPEGL